MSDYINKVVDAIVDDFNTRVSFNRELIRVGTTCSLSVMPIGLLRVLSISSLLFDSTHICFNSKLYTLEELTPDVEFNLRLSMSDEDFIRYCIAVEVNKKIQIPSPGYIHVTVLWKLLK